MNTAIARVGEFLGLRRNIVMLLCLVVVVMTGEKTWERFLPKYLEGIGSSVLIIAGFGFLQNFLGAFWSLPGGYIADIVGNKKSFLIFNLMAAGGYLIALLFTSWAAVFIGLVFFSAWGAVSLPASMSLITRSLGRNKTAMGISMHSIVRRIPMMIGPVIGGMLISGYGLVIGIKIAFSFSLVLCLAGIIFQKKLIHEQRPEHEKLHPYELWRRFDPRLKNLLVSDILIRFCEQIPYVFVVLWCINTLKASPEQFGYLTAVEMATAALIYIPVASFSDRLERKPFVVITFVFFSVFPVFLYYTNNNLMLIFAFIIRGLKEFGEPTRKAMILDLAPANAEARTVGLYYFIRDTIVAFAAFFGGWLWSIGPEYNFFSATAFGVLGTLYFALLGKGVNDTRTVRN